MMEYTKDQIKKMNSPFERMFGAKFISEDENTKDELWDLIPKLQRETLVNRGLITFTTIDCMHCEKTIKVFYNYRKDFNNNRDECLQGVLCPNCNESGLYY